MTKCPTCDREMQMYYRELCFWCYKPEPKGTKISNLMEALYYLEKRRKGIQDRLWQYWFDMGLISNDIATKIHGPGIFDGMTAKESKLLVEDWKFFLSEFPFAEEVWWEISW